MPAVMNDIGWDWARALMNKINWYWAAHYENDVIDSDYEARNDLTEWKLLNIQHYRLNEMKNRDVNALFEKRIIVTGLMIESRRISWQCLLKYLWHLCLDICDAYNDTRHLMTLMLMHSMTLTFILLSRLNFI